MQNPSPVSIFTKSLFQHGLESYDSNLKTSINAGGAQIFQLRNWKSPQSRIRFNNEAFGGIITKLPATLYTVNRVRLDASGLPVKLPSGRNQRVNNGLMLYMQYGEDGESARGATKLIIEACPELNGYVAAVADLVESCPEVNNLTAVKVPAFGGGELQPMNLLKCVMLAVTSGSANSSQYWSFSATATRSSIDSRTTMPSSVDINDLI